jgi:hypothetical protein
VEAALARVRLGLAHLSRYSWVLWTLLLLVSMALSLGAGIKWECFEVSW